MKCQVLHNVWCNSSGEALGEFWNWSLSGVKGFIPQAWIYKRYLPRRAWHPWLCLRWESRFFILTLRCRCHTAEFWSVVSVGYSCLIWKRLDSSCKLDETVRDGQFWNSSQSQRLSVGRGAAVLCQREHCGNVHGSRRSWKDRVLLVQDNTWR